MHLTTHNEALVCRHYLFPGYLFSVFYGCEVCILTINIREREDARRPATVLVRPYVLCLDVLRRSYARLKYPFVSVLIRTTSPCSMNGGTRVFSPVSRTASFIWLVAVAPLMPGAVSVTFRSTVFGRS